MQLIYATGKPGQMSFSVANMPTSLPPEALVYAICDGTSAIERIDECTYEAMSDLEYLTFKQIVDDAHEQELKRVRKTIPVSAFRRFLNGLLGETVPQQRQNVQAVEV